MALHKILILARYDKDEFQYYLDAYLEEEQKALRQYRMDEVREFLRKVRSCIVGYGEDDRIDLYLAQTDTREFWEFEGDFTEAGMRLSDRTCWTDSQAYEILTDLYKYQPKRIALHGKNGAVGSQADPCIRIHCMYCAQPEILQAGTASAESKPQQPKEAATGPQQPKEAATGPQRLKGTVTGELQRLKGTATNEPQRLKGTVITGPQRLKGTVTDGPQRSKAGNAQPSLATLMRQLAEGRNP